MPVADEGSGVGYLARARAAGMAENSRCDGDVARRLIGRGNASGGDDDTGSNAGSKDDAGRLLPATWGGGDEDTRAFRGESMSGYLYV